MYNPIKEIVIINTKIHRVLLNMKMVKTSQKFGPIDTHIPCPRIHVRIGLIEHSIVQSWFSFNNIEFLALILGHQILFLIRRGILYLVVEGFIDVVYTFPLLKAV